MTHKETAGHQGVQPPSLALAEPTVNVRHRWTTSIVLVNVGINAAFFGPIQVLLGQQAADFSEADKEGILALVTGAGAAVSLVANPLFGTFSDRTTSRFGRRVPWVFIGALLGTIGLVGLAGAPTVAAMTLLWCLVQLGCNGALAATTAAIPDQVPVRQRGSIGGLASMGTVAGILVGAAIAAVVAGNFSLGFIICAVALIVGMVPYLFFSNDPVLDAKDRPAFTWPAFFTGFWISPRRYPDFAWAWITRFLVNVGNHLVTLYLLFFLTDAVGFENPEFGVLILTGIYAVLTLITAVIGGRWTDKVGKRKPFVIVSSGIIALAALILAFFPTWPGALTGAAVLGIGYGVYLAVDFALLTQVLPSAANRGKDMGVINVANSLPQVIAPIIAWPLVTILGGYVTLYVVAAVIGLLGAFFVVKIKGVD
ncbi:major facilitator transporter [Arthrobacter sp. PAMC 25486]|uniref:MFS transporter n=1 Tax=Arthrobacter sp. PAMC 25486 TaxID=1494608 RepID=UPI000535D10C|nr:MFS transporter [Arthrobacter sp. PAMC 25486]AIY02468.1 major facilitator transporter [Arthrobacter sp. PAMC 25486]